MPHNRSATALPTIGRIAGKEITLFFTSPVAYLFLAAFAAVSLFIVFWGETFFARNIADVRPLFEWLPILLIFLASTLTMRLWSEERRTGTLEHLLTQPVPIFQFVLGKFAGCLLLLAVALLITLPLPITISLFADLDWGPIISGYIAALLLGAAYLSIGLFVSSRCDNQIVSLIGAVALCGAFYLIGSPLLTAWVNTDTAEWLRLLGSGSRFDSITRGVLDLRDLYYYLSLIGVFLVLNVYALERERWARGGRPHHLRWQWATALVALNLLAANLWLGQVHGLRVDTTEGNQYTLSDTTHRYLDRLREPLHLQGYFSEKTHPLLAPLVPQMRDLMREYAAVGGDRVRVTFADPTEEPELEKRLNRQMGVKPVPLQVADRHQSSIVSSYFHVVAEYGDEREVLSFRDLIEIKAGSESDLQVKLRNPEYDLTRAVRNVQRQYQAGGNLFNTIEGKVTFEGFISPKGQLPPELADFRQTIEPVLEQFTDQSDGQFSVRFRNPEAGDGQLAQTLAEEYGFQPMAASLFSNETFYFYLTLNKGEQRLQIPLGDMTKESFRRNVEAALKRFSSGFTKTIALVTPLGGSPSPYGMPAGPRFTELESFLRQDYQVLSEDLSDGSVSGRADALLLAGARGLDAKALFAIDQFLMKGGTVIAAASPYSAQLGQQRLELQSVKNGLGEWLSHHGLGLTEALVMDPESGAFPLPVSRNVGGYQVQQMQMLDYPYFIDVRGDRLNQDHAITGGLHQVTVPWASPIKVDKAVASRVTPLMHSSGQSWTSTSMSIMPQWQNGQLTPFRPSGDRSSHTLAVIREDGFTSYFEGKTSPLLDQSEPSSEKDGNSDGNKASDKKEEKELVISSVIEQSSESARLVLFASSDLWRDQALRLASASSQSEYLGSLQLLGNTLDWALDDSGLSQIRARGHFSRTLPPMDAEEQRFWEWLNYGLALACLLLVALIHRQIKAARERRYQQQLAN